MKKVCKRKLATLIAAAALAPTAMAGYTTASGPVYVPPIVSDATISIKDIELKPGMTYTTDVSINLGTAEILAEDGYRGFQFDLSKLPAGISISNIRQFIGNWSVESNVMADGSTRILAYTSDAPSKNKDYILTIDFTAATDAPLGTSTVNITNVDFSSPKGVDVTGDDSSFKITVTEEPVNPPVFGEKLLVDPSTLTLTVGEAPYGLKATILPAELDQQVTWSSSDPSVASVDAATGYVTPVAPGTATITATSVVTLDENGQHLTGTSVVTVIEKTPGNEVTSITVSPKTAEINEGASVQLTATVSPDSANQEVVWTTGDASIATVDANGLVTGVKMGSVRITATTVGLDINGNPMSDYSYITVTEIPNPWPEAMVTPGMTVDGANYFKVDELNYIVESGAAVNMYVTVAGGNPDGWSFTWREKGQTAVAGTAYILQTMAQNDSEQPLTKTYELAVKNEWNGQVLFEETSYNYTYTVYMEGTVNGKPDSDHEGWIPGPGNNGTFIYGAHGAYANDVLKIREGNSLDFYVSPVGGYLNDWSYLWTAPDGAQLGTQQSVETTAQLYPEFTTIYGTAAAASDREATSDNTYYVTLTNYGPDNLAWYKETLPTAKVQVYKRPQAPTQLLRKGEGNKEVGTSHTFVVMMTPLDNQEILDLGYTYTYGYTDQNGAMHVLETTEKRYTHTTGDIYWNSGYKFWAYSNWHYPDGSVVTSGLRYLSATADSQGEQDYDFDASVFSGTRSEASYGTNGVDGVEADETITGIYTIDGKFVGTDPDALDGGLYIIKTNNSAKKVII